MLSVFKLFKLNKDKTLTFEELNDRIEGLKVNQQTIKAELQHP